MTDVEAWASFAIYAGDLVSDAVTAALGVWPDEVTPKGTPHHGGRVQKVTYWGLDSKGKVAGTDPDAHLRSLLDRIEPAAGALDALRAAHPEVAARVWILWSQEIAIADFTLAAPTLARMAALGAGWSISIITAFTEDYTDDEEDVIGAAALSAGGEVLADSAGALDNRRLDDHVDHLLTAAASGASTSPPVEVVLTWILARDDSNPQILRERVAGLAALGVPVRVRIGARA